jgi:hypothetical protein
MVSIMISMTLCPPSAFGVSSVRVHALKATAVIRIARETRLINITHYYIALSARGKALSVANARE